MLPRLKVNRHFPKVMINLPYFLGGLNLPRYEWEQAVQHLSVFSLLYNNASPMGNMFTVTLEYCQLHVGTTMCFLHTSYNKFGNRIPRNWMSIIWEFL